MHHGSGRIVVRDLSKSFGLVEAVRNLSFTVEPGSVTGFFGPNGSGKTTTLRMLLGLITPSAGTATIDDQPFSELPAPARTVGAVLEAQGFHPGRTARNHLRCHAAAIDVPDQQVDRVLDLVGLTEAANRSAGAFSLGMRQRLALATALLGDPQVLVLDEPSNGLDPEGIAWLRGFLASFAATGRTVLLSSHLLREMERAVDHVVIISRGECVYNGALDQLRAQQRSRVLVQPSDPEALSSALRAAGHTVERLPDGRLVVHDGDARTVADLALAAGVAVYGLQDEQVDLEQLFFQLTSGQYQSAPSGWAHQPGAHQPGTHEPGTQQPGATAYYPAADTPASGGEEQRGHDGTGRMR